MNSALQIQWPLDDDVTNYVLESILYPDRHKKDEERLLPDYPRIHKELARKGVTLSLLWTEYCMEAKNAGKIRILIPWNPTELKIAWFHTIGLR